MQFGCDFKPVATGPIGFGAGVNGQPCGGGIGAVGGTDQGEAADVEQFLSYHPFSQSAAGATAANMASEEVERFHQGGDLFGHGAVVKVRRKACGSPMP